MIIVVAKRLLSYIASAYPQRQFIVVEDALASNGPHVSLLNELKMNFIIGVKPAGNASLFDEVGRRQQQLLTEWENGAGRTMSRTAGKKACDTRDLVEQTQGKECCKDAAVVDEIPAANKDIGQVMENQSELVGIVHTLKQVVCVKG